jgi:hypothetical protein
MQVLSDLSEMRKILHNYIDYAMGERLSSIKKALPSFWSSRPKGKTSTKSKPRTTATTSVSEVPPGLELNTPLVPLSSAAGRPGGDVGPLKKIKRKRKA